jgi:hypothetical protein
MCLCGFQWEDDCGWWIVKCVEESSLGLFRGTVPMKKITKSIQDNLPLGWKLNLKPPKYKCTYKSYIFAFVGSNCLMVLRKIFKVINFLKDYFASVLLSWMYTILVIALEPEISYIFIIDISVLSRSIATKLSWLLTSFFHKLRSHSCVNPLQDKV